MSSRSKDFVPLTISKDFRTVQSENGRKEKFFEACLDYLSEFHAAVGEAEFEEIHEGMGAVSSLSTDRIGFIFDDGRLLEDIPISAEISQMACNSDCMYVVAVRQKDKWRLLDVISVCSVIYEGFERIHIAYNPLYANDLPAELSILSVGDKSHSL